MNWTQILTSITSRIFAGAGVYALQNWKREFRIRQRHDVAKKFIGAVLDVRYAFTLVRSQFQSRLELEAAFQSKYPGRIFDFIEDGDDSSAALYEQRLAVMGDAFNVLRSAAIEAEVIFGKQFRDAHLYLWRERAKLLTALRKYYQPMLSERSMPDEEYDKIDKILYDSTAYSPADVRPDEFQQGVEDECNRLLAMSRQYLAWNN